MGILLNDNNFTGKIFNAATDEFESIALDIFRFQFEHNNIYRQYCEAIKTNTSSVSSIKNIPFLPISFFKTHEITTGLFEPALVFESSGTTGAVNSRHFVKEKEIYEESFLKTFELFYGPASNYCVIGLLPSYLERQHSSLVYMVNELINQCKHPSAGFYLYNTEKLYHTLLENEKNKQPTLLIGVTYALLDFAEKFQMNLQHTIIMETGGMKGRREELTREQVHQQLKQRLGLTEIHSEYGMTELLSQAYSKKNSLFNCPPWMQVLLRAEDDPFEITTANHTSKTPVTGVINIIDLANLYSCSFIATDDVGKLYADGSFEVLGRLDNSDMRGCGLMIV